MNPSAAANRATLLLTVFLASGAMLFKATAAEVPAPRLTWQVSPDELRLLPPWRDASGLRLAWHDPTGIRAALEWSTDLRQWNAEGSYYIPALNNFVRHPRPRLVWQGPGIPQLTVPSVTYRLRRLPKMREGYVLFGNRVTSAGINAPVTSLGDMRPGSPGGGPGLADSRFLAQLFVTAPGIYSGPVGVPVPFRHGAFAGYISSHAVAVPMNPTEDIVHVMMLAWLAELGETFEEAGAQGVGMIGSSGILEIKPALDATSAPTPLAGLLGFSIAQIAGSGPPTP